MTEPPDSKKRKISDEHVGPKEVEPLQKADKKAVYTFDCDFYRGGSVCGTFVQEIQKIDDAKRQDHSIYFGEVLGKHSQIEAYFSDLDLKKITDDEKLVDAFEEILRLANKTHFGYNPFDYIEEYDDEEDDSDDDEEEDDSQ